MIEWKDVSTWSRGDKDRTPKTWKAEIGRFRLVVTRHIHCPEDAWVTICKPFWDEWVLGSKDIDKAKEEAVGMLRKELEEALAVIGES